MIISCLGFDSVFCNNPFILSSLWGALWWCHQCYLPSASCVRLSWESVCAEFLKLRMWNPKHCSSCCRWVVGGSHSYLRLPEDLRLNIWVEEFLNLNFKETNKKYFFIFSLNSRISFISLTNWSVKPFCFAMSQWRDNHREVTSGTF